jgi:hypothetical protein
MKPSNEAFEVLVKWARERGILKDSGREEIANT